GFLFELTDVDPIGFAKYLPVNRPDFVALHVGSVFAKLDAVAFVRRAMLPAAKPLHDLASQQFEIFDSVPLSGGEQFAKLHREGPLEDRTAGPRQFRQRPSNQIVGPNPFRLGGECWD